MFNTRIAEFRLTRRKNHYFHSMFEIEKPRLFELARLPTELNLEPQGGMICETQNVSSPHLSPQPPQNQPMMNSEWEENPIEAVTAGPSHQTENDQPNQISSTFPGIEYTNIHANINDSISYNPQVMHPNIRIDTPIEEMMQDPVSTIAREWQEQDFSTIPSSVITADDLEEILDIFNEELPNLQQYL